MRNGRLGILAANSMGRALYVPLFEDLGPTVRNMARFIVINSRAAQLFPDWQEFANGAVAILRALAGRYPFDRRLSDLIAEPSTRSDEFRVLWAAQDMKFHRTGAAAVSPGR